jgi:hypothetical protein
MTKRTAARIQAFRVKGRQPIVDARAQVYRESTTIPAKNPLMVRVTWKREAYLIWLDNWDAASEE